MNRLLNLWLQFYSRSHLRRIVMIAAAVFLVDQLTKRIVLHFIAYGEQRVLLTGFFKLVYWGNTGAAWSLFYGNNKILALVSLLAFLVLIWNHRHFDSHTVAGQFALGLLFGGITGNLMDRIQVGHVIDFLYFYIHRRGGGELGFPAFNVADMSICTGVAMALWLSWRSEPESQPGSPGNKTDHP